MVKKTEIDKEMLAQIQRLNTEQELVDHLGYTFEQLRKLPVSDLRLKADVQKEMNRLKEAIKKERRRHFKEMYGHDIKIVSIVCVIVIIGAFVAFFVYPNYIQEHPIEAIEIENLNTVMEVGEGYSFTYNIIPSNATNKDVEWEIRGLSGNVLEGATITSDKSLIRISLDPAMFFDGDKINLVAINHASKVYQSATITVKSDFEFTPFKGVSKDISAGSTVEIDPKLPSSTSYKAEWSVKVSSEFLSYSVSGNILKLQASSLASKGDRFDITIRYGKYGPVDYSVTVAEGFIFDPFKDVPTFNLVAGDKLTINPVLPSDIQDTISWSTKSSDVVKLETAGNSVTITVKTLTSSKSFDIKATYGPFTKEKEFKVTPLDIEMMFNTDYFVGFETFDAELSNSEKLSNVNRYWSATDGVFTETPDAKKATFRISESVSDGTISTITVSLAYEDLKKTITKDIVLTSAATGIHYISDEKQMDNVRIKSTYKYCLMDDLTLSDWSPRSFAGTFDGNGKKINLIFSGKPQTFDNEKNYGLFTILTGTVKNLEIDCNIHIEKGSTVNVGGVCGRINGGTVTGCVVTGTIEANAADALLDNADIHVGGIAGIAKGTNKIEQCYTFGSLYGKAYSAYIGGIVGFIESGDTTIKYCLNGKVTSGDNNYKIDARAAYVQFGACYGRAGGMVGIIDSGNLRLDHCISSAIIHSEGNAKKSAGMLGCFDNGTCTMSYVAFLKDSLFEGDSQTAYDNVYYQGSKTPTFTGDNSILNKDELSILIDEWFSI